MAISHLCNSCGVDLVGVTPLVDPPLNLPIVVCPACELACVRRRHPIQTFWRRARRADTAGSLLFVQIVIAVSLLRAIGSMTADLAVTAAWREETALAFVSGAFGEQEPVKRLGARVLYNDDGRDSALIVAAIISAIAGIWLTATMTHLRLASRWAIWVGLTLGWVSLGWAGWALNSALALLVGDATLATRPDAGLWWMQLTFLAGCVACMLAASPLGFPVRWIIGLLRGSMWRRQLNKARRSAGRDE